jgi:hypothetical protein
VNSSQLINTQRKVIKLTGISPVKTGTKEPGTEVNSGLTNYMSIYAKTETLTNINHGNYA